MLTNGIQYIWWGFATLFFALAIYHFWKARQKVGPFENKAEFKAMNGMSTGVIEFIADFNLYISGVNKNNTTANRIAGCGYLFAGLTAAVSAWMALQ